MIEAVTTSPLFGIVLCIGTFQIGRWVQKKTGLTLCLLYTSPSPRDED